MNVLLPAEFSNAAGISVRASQLAYKNGSEGKPWRGHRLPVIALDGHRGGAGGKAWGLVLDAASPELRALLKLPETPASTLPSTAVEPRLKGRPDDRHFALSLDKQRIIAPILETKRGSSERAEAFRAVVAKPHRYGDGWKQLSERTLRDWVKAHEERGPGALVPVARRDRGKPRVRLSREWDRNCGLAEEVQVRIGVEIEETARGLIVKGRSDREVRRLCSNELARLTTEAGVKLPKKRLKELCQLARHWPSRFAEMKPVRDYLGDHKRYSDEHEFRVQRSLTREPMEVLMGDVHHVDMSVAEARRSLFAEVRQAGKHAEKQGFVSIRVSIIGWLDGSSHYLWATPVILSPGQGITQRDVARSLFDVVTCPHGGIPREIVIDNGGEFGALGEGVARFAAMSEFSGLGVVKSRPYSPEGKGRLEGAFGILEHRFLSALPGYIAGDRMKSPTKSKGKPVDPYPHGPERLVADILLAVAQYNGTAQDGQLAGLSPKAMLEAKAGATGWAAQVPDADSFDVIFSREVRRDVRKGAITIGGAGYSGAVLAHLVGEKQVPFLVPSRDPDGPILNVRKDENTGKLVIHHLYPETFDLNDRSGADRKGEMVNIQNAEMKRRKATADLGVDVQALLSAGADLDPVTVNPPDTWTLSTLDKAGVIGGALTEEEAKAAEDARYRANIEELLTFAGLKSRGANGSHR